MLKTEAVSQHISQRSIKPFFLDEQSKYRTFGKKYKKAMEQSIWQEIGQLYQKFQELGIREAVNYEKYYHDSPLGGWQRQDSAFADELYPILP